MMYKQYVVGCWMLLALLTDYGARSAQYSPGGAVNELTGHEDVNNFQQGRYVITIYTVKHFGLIEGIGKVK